MAKGVLVHRADSHYDDLPERQYQFPSGRYIKRIEQFVGDWIVYYEPRGGGGRMGYTAIARVDRIIPDPNNTERHLALMKEGSFLPLDEFVPYLGPNGYWESELNKPDGTLNKGAIQWAVRPISDTDFGRILAQGFPVDDDILPRTDPDTDPRYSGVADEEQPFEYDFERERAELKITKPLRSRIFRKKVLDAYGARCAFTGFQFINGGGRAEVEAAHIIPVEHGGSDSVRNGMALSGTVHWMFDRGLLSVADSDEILVSRHINNPDEIDRLLNKNKRAKFPEHPNLRPHSEFLKWHRENCFKH